MRYAIKTRYSKGLQCRRARSLARDHLFSHTVSCFGCFLTDHKSTQNLNGVGTRIPTTMKRRASPSSTRSRGNEIERVSRTGSSRCKKGNGGLSGRGVAKEATTDASLRCTTKTNLEQNLQTVLSTKTAITVDSATARRPQSNSVRPTQPPCRNNVSALVDIPVMCYDAKENKCGMGKHRTPTPVEKKACLVKTAAEHTPRRSRWVKARERSPLTQASPSSPERRLTKTNSKDFVHKPLQATQSLKTTIPSDRTEVDPYNTVYMDDIHKPTPPGTFTARKKTECKDEIGFLGHSIAEKELRFLPPNKRKRDNDEMNSVPPYLQKRRKIPVASLPLKKRPLRELAMRPPGAKIKIVWTGNSL